MREPGRVAAGMPSGMPIEQRRAQRAAHDEQRCREATQDRIAHDLAREQRLAEIAVQRVPQPRAVLHEERPVETVELADLRDAGGGGVVAGQGDGDSPGTSCSRPKTMNVASTITGKICTRRRRISLRRLRVSMCSHSFPSRLPFPR